MVRPIFANDQIYHVFNRGIEKRPVFTHRKEYERIRLALDFYRFRDLGYRLSFALRMPKGEHIGPFEYLRKHGHPRVEILAYCIMPNHFHLLIRQRKENGVIRFIADVTNSYTRYFNTRHKNRVGPLFQGRFKAVRIEDEDQLLHVSRYIHINPVVSYLVDWKNAETYEWSSLTEYLDGESSVRMCETETVLGYFPNRAAYRLFLADQVDYGKTLEHIKHCVFE